MPKLPLSLIYLIVKLLLNSLTPLDLIVKAALELISVLDLRIEPLLRVVVATCAAAVAVAAPIASGFNDGYFVDDLKIILWSIETFDWCCNNA
ncbi:hypothetical protein CGRA01v4_04099 [Colletotrichum graminicola]|uniref:Uncharacterized protein n=1 Tax=Colletotrichum graminicola (strain M1.001 / M2 / FGSC 10212) TaxID=645133 RepID=E3QXK6_COLGM|nr:uncharacterized protein GLRG_10738 [Colletotrichum graminicola M1.001]EFQ35594.1 hypothetical protein GLRG_10738 [Colletotrichum graminicola M1.001]WDK12818.1 hypothetical protein CGRA01v4_04099 [Colletotrichum graminicola]